MNKKRAKQPDLMLGQLPVETINQVLELELEAGEVVISTAAQRHAASRHPNEYSICLPLLAGVIASPLYVGDDFRNEGKIEIVGGSVPPDGLLLIAVCIEPDGEGRYHVASFYPISRTKAQNRREKGRLKVAVKR